MPNQPTLALRAALQAVSLAALLTAPLLPSAAADQPELELRIDRQLIEGALSSAPLDAIRDPRAATALTEIRLQLERLARIDFRMPLADFLAAPRSLRLCGFNSGAVRYDHVALAVDAGAATLPLRDWAELMSTSEPLSPAQCGSASGLLSTDNGFIGAHGERFLIGDRDHIAELDAAPAQPAASPPLVCACAGDVVRQMLTPGDGASPLFAPLVGGLLPLAKGSAPSIEATATPGGAFGWTSTFAVRGISAAGRRPISPRLAAAVRGDQHLTIALGVDPAWIARLLAAVGSQALPGPLTSALSTQCTGDALLQASWGASTMPSAALTFLVEDAAPIAAALGRLPGASSAPLADGTPSWSLALGMPLVVAAARGRCVAATDAATALAALNASRAAPAAWPAADALSCDADLQSIGARLLPLATMLISDASAPIADPLTPLRWLCARAIAGDDERALAAAVATNPGVASGIQGFCGGGLDRLTAVVSCYRSPSDHGLQSAVVVFKAIGGYHVVSQAGPEFDNTVQSLAEVQKIVQGWARSHGAALDALPVIAPSEAPTISARWLPSVNVLVSHLKPYHLDVVAAGGALTCSDHGLPVAGFTGLSMAFGLYMDAVVAREVQRQQLQVVAPPMPHAPAPAPAPAPARQNF